MALKSTRFFIYVSFVSLRSQRIQIDILSNLMRFVLALAFPNHEQMLTDAFELFRYLFAINIIEYNFTIDTLVHTRFINKIFA